MKRYCFLLILLHIILTIFINESFCQGWRSQYSGTNENLRSVFFIDNYTGIIVGDNGVILKTSNGGHSWTVLKNVTTENLRKVSFTHPDTGIAVGDNGTIVRTINGGETWICQKSGTTKNLKSVSFFNSAVGIAVGDSGAIIRTIDGGDNWIQQENNITDHLYSISYVDTNRWLVSGDSGKLFQSIDDGITWVENPNIVTTKINAIFFVDSTYGIIVGDAGTILLTTDGGKNWTKKQHWITHDLKDVFFTNRQIGTIVGSDGTIFRTTDGGENWTCQTSGVYDEIYGDDLYGVSFCDINSGYIVGENGILLFTDNGGMCKHGPIFQAFLNRIDSTQSTLHNSIVDSFMTKISIFPLIEEDSIAYFIFQGNANSVILEGDIHAPLTRLCSTKLWFAQFMLERDARIHYLYNLDSEKESIDPLNPNRFETPYYNISVLLMPDYIEPPEILYYPDIPHGTLHDTTLVSTNLGDSRIIQVYTPPSYDSTLADSLPVAIFNDGNTYINNCFANNTIDYLIAEKRIQPIICVFIHPKSRWEEFAGRDVDNHSAFIINEVLPYIDNRYRTIHHPESRAVIGLSLSGHFATHITFYNTESFGLCGVQSPAYYANNKNLVNFIINQPKKDLKFYIDWGTHEQPIKTNALPFKNDLIALGYDVQWNEWHEGHQITNFRAHLDNVLESLFPVNITNIQDNNELPSKLSLMQNYPNPFNLMTSISYQLPKSNDVNLIIYNTMGQKVKTLVKQKQNAGFYQVQWNGRNEVGMEVTTGVYFYSLKVGSFMETKKMLVIK